MLLAYLADLYEAIQDRNELRVHLLLRAPVAGSIPVGVRDEALALVRLPMSSTRAPMQLFMFMHRMEQLILDDEPEEEVEEPPFQDPDQLPLPLPLVSGGER